MGMTFTHGTLTFAMGTEGYVVRGIRCCLWEEKEFWHAGMKRVAQHPFRLPIGILPQDILAYTDASYTGSPPSPQCEAGMILHQAGRMILNCIPLSSKFSIFDAQVTATVIGIQGA